MCGSVITHGFIINIGKAAQELGVTKTIKNIIVIFQQYIVFEIFTV